MWEGGGKVMGAASYCVPIPFLSADRIGSERRTM
jgi:hypothetical protein